MDWNKVTGMFRPSFNSTGRGWDGSYLNLGWNHNLSFLTIGLGQCQIGLGILANLFLWQFHKVCSRIPMNRTSMVKIIFNFFWKRFFPCTWKLGLIDFSINFELVIIIRGVISLWNIILKFWLSLRRYFFVYLKKLSL